MKKPAESKERLSARERLLNAAEDLFYSEGINSVGIDRVIEHAGVAKASLYDCFGSKEALVRAYLERRQQRRRQRLAARLAGLESPRERILAVFGLLREMAAEPNFCGCAFYRASVEIREDSSVRAVVDESRAWNLSVFRQLAEELGVADPALLGQQLLSLYDGAMVATSTDHNPAAAAAAHAAAAALIDIAAPPVTQSRAA